MRRATSCPPVRRRWWRRNVLLDELMPVCDVVGRHRINVRARTEVVFRAISTADLGGGVVTTLLLAIRAVPAAVVAFVRSPRSALARWRKRRSTGRRGLRLADYER